MERQDSVIVAREENGKIILNSEFITAETVPDSLNSESGFHVYHVRMLTELILRRIANTKEKYAFTEEEIEAMAMASSLHDIGKMKVPQSLLDFPGKLSPLEYDLIKKHSAFGDEIIAEAEGNIDEKVRMYARQIARSHHERYDGSGYPDGLIGDDIPICAQAVSLADAFDALTSARSYKQAFSQDVAIEMIANGMCGVFNEDLIECLIQVINHKDLTEIREKLEKARSTIQQQNLYVPKSVLFVGNTGYLTPEFIEETFYESRVMIVGESNIKTLGRVKVYSDRGTSFDKVFDTYEFDLVIYLSSELTYQNDTPSDAEELRQILNYIKDTQKEAKFLYLSSLDGAFQDKTDKSLLAESKENLCQFFQKNHGIDTKIVRIPYLYSGTKKDDFLYRAFYNMEKERPVEFLDMGTSRTYFISLFDLSELLIRLADHWEEGAGILNINDEWNISFSDIAEKLAELTENFKVDFKGETAEHIFDANNRAVRAEYGWFPKISILQEIEEEHQKFTGQKAVYDMNFGDKIKAWLKQHAYIAKAIEIGALFIITEVLMLLTNSSTVFSIVDFRMAFIVIVATLHGLTYGMAAAGLTSISWLIAKMISGTKWLTIFYEPSNWLAFVYFFLIGGLCGYIKLRSDNKSKDLTERNSLLEEKLYFAREVYSDTYQEKKDLKKQIVGSKDSFGKIYDVIRQLDTIEPRRLYLKIMDTFEDILENKSISVYSVNENSAFGRLEVASRDIMTNVSRSVSLETFAPVMEALTRGEVWRNTSLMPGLPMYASGIYREGKVELLIFVWHAKSDQRSLYYVNLFKIMCDLAAMSLLRAYDFNQATFEKQYIDGTHILNAENYSRIRDNFRQMADRKVFAYTELAIETKGYSYPEIDEILSKRIRANDILGVTEEGSVRILLSQATKEDLSFVLPRFDGLDITVTVL